MATKEETLFGDLEEYKLWRKEWKGMPEFVQNDLTSSRQVVIHFRCQEDVDDFAKLVDQRIGYKTKFIWYPKAEIVHRTDKLYVDEPKVSSIHRIQRKMGHTPNK